MDIINVLLEHERDLLLSASDAQDRQDFHTQKFYESEADLVRNVRESILKNKNKEKENA